MMSFFRRIFRRRHYLQPAHALYTAAVTRSRDPALYRAFEVPDTTESRFDMLVLHVFLILHRLRHQGDAAVELGHEVVNILVGDMDRTFRDMGVADVGVGKRVKKVLKAFYGRVGAYDAALEDGDAALEASLTRNIYRGNPPAPERLAGLAQYVRVQADHLAAQPVAQVLSGRVDMTVPVVDRTSQATTTGVPYSKAAS